MRISLAIALARHTSIDLDTTGTGALMSIAGVGVASEIFSALGSGALSSLASSGSGSVWVPTTKSGCQAWYDAALGITLGGTPRASGTAPPPVTLTGTLSQSLGLYIQIDLLGVRGTATFKYSVDNGSTFIATGVATAATVALTGAASGITVNFPVGTYATDNIWQATVAQWNDQSGNANHLVQATASKQPLYVKSAQNGRPAIRWNGTSNILGPLSFTLSQPTTLSMAYKSITIGNGTTNDILIDGGTVGTMFYYADSSPLTQIYAGNTGVQFAGRVADGVYAYLTAEYNTTSSLFRINAVQKASGNVGNSNAGGLTIGAAANNTRWTNIEVAELYIHSSALAGSDLTNSELYMSKKYAI